MRRALLLLLTAATLFAVWTMILGDALDHTLDENQPQIDKALHSCNTVWVEHKIRPTGPDEVLAKDC